MRSKELSLRGLAGVVVAIALVVAVALVPLNCTGSPAADDLSPEDGGEAPQLSGTVADYEELALDYVAQTHGLQRDRLKLVHHSVATTQSHGDIWCGRVLDLDSYNIYDICFSDSDVPVDLDTIVQQEKQGHKDERGKIADDYSWQRFQQLEPDEVVRVGIWLVCLDREWLDIVTEILSTYPPEIREKLKYGSATTDDLREDPSLHEWEIKLERDKEEALKQKYAVSEDPVVGFLEDRGCPIVYVSEYAPLIFAEVTKEVIVQLGEREDVTGIYMDDIEYELAQNTAVLTERADVVWGRGITGADYGHRVAVVEQDGIEFSNPNLANGQYCHPTYPNIGAHATAVAGIIASTDATYRGVAPGVPALLSANSLSGHSSDLIDASEWAMNNDAWILNYSVGADTSQQMRLLDRYLDHVVYWHSRSITVAAGNDAGAWGSRTGNVNSPGLGWNVMTVGSINDDDTSSSWGDDEMSDFSSYVDPISPHNDKEKPEVVAVGDGPGYNMSGLTTADPWIGSIGAGTSFAAPAVAGEAALLMDRNDSLFNKPEAVKAIIMVSAVHNIEGDLPLSDRDGAGAIACSKADDIVTGNKWS